jgi:hypothetical protein
MLGYISVIDALTINEENRLRRENQILQINKDKLEARLDKLEEMYRSLL